MLSLYAICGRDRLETRHGKLAERQYVIAVPLFKLKHLIDPADAKNVGSQGVVDAANEADHVSGNARQLWMFLRPAIRLTIDWRWERKAPVGRRVNIGEAANSQQSKPRAQGAGGDTD
jgi:hypothetical protein